MNTPVVGAALQLQKCLALAGWEISYIDLDLTGERPKVQFKLERCDGRWLLGGIDQWGRARYETFHREITLGLDRGTTGRRPLSHQVDDIFLGRQRCLGARHLLRAVTFYLADNALAPVPLSDMRRAWAGVMRAPLRLGVAKEGCSGGMALGTVTPG